ncbi:MAG: hypothetical protein A2W68_11075 [Betaproteobacteria bacterium RIFCSPLOWO2_02_64_14]|nr:MAG: hypothetical protein A2W68_11075 [Betaproteobacteria bacterium RIFCSPLOWO2_02_64_14]
MGIAVAREEKKVMFRWGSVVSGFYAAVVLLLLLPGGALLAFKHTPPADEVLQMYLHWFPWLYAGVLVGGEALLLFLSVDTSWRRMRPRQHVAVTAALASFFAAVLAVCVIFAIEVVVYADNSPPLWEGRDNLFFATALGVWVCLWLIWGGIFIQYYRDSSKAVSAAVTWLLKGSVLELLIAVPSHVFVRQRGDCSAPAVTAFGIVTGIAIMLLAFGPGVLALYKKRLDAYARNSRQSS